VVLAATRASIRLGPARSDYREVLGSVAANRRAGAAEGLHSVDRTLALCRAVGDPRPAAEYGLASRTGELERARSDLGEIPDPLVAFSVGRREDVREWPDEGYLAAVRLLSGSGVRVLLLSGPKHRDRALLLAGRTGATVRAGTTDLRGLLAHLHVLRERRGVLVACDSAPIHLATAVGLPVVALSGPQDPRRTGPYGRTDSAITRWEGLACAPCLKRTCRHREEPRACMRRIGPADVVRRALALLRSSSEAEPRLSRWPSSS
jgi:ADP-heptose:LPS heptosyltransferase